MTYLGGGGLGFRFRRNLIAEEKRLTAGNITKRPQAEGSPRLSVRVVGLTLKKGIEPTWRWIIPEDPYAASVL